MGAPEADSNKGRVLKETMKWFRNSFPQHVARASPSVVDLQEISEYWAGVAEQALASSQDHWKCVISTRAKRAIYWDDDVWQLVKHDDFLLYDTGKITKYQFGRRVQAVFLQNRALASSQGRIVIGSMHSANGQASPNAIERGHTHAIQG